MLPSSERPQQQLGWREAALAALACAVLASAVLYQPLFAGRCTRTFTSDDPRIDLHPWARAASGPLPPINPISPDVDAFVLPGMMRARQIEESGRLPWWDGSQALGYPLVACIPFPFFSPATWLTRPLDPMTALDWMLWFHFALAALLAYRACRAFGASPPAAAAGAVGFALSAWVYTRWQSPHEVYTISWWPAQVLAVEWLRQGRFRRAISEGALATGLMMLSGFPQVAFVLAFGTILFATLQRSLWNVRAGFVLAAALLIGLALGLPQMLLSGDAYESSLRSAPETRQAAAERGLAPAALATAVLPELFGHPPDFSLPDAPAQTMEAWLPHRRWLGDEIQNSIPYNAFYCGVLVLLLLPLAFRRALAPFARRLVLVSLVAFAACLVGPALMRLVPGADVLAMGNIKRMLALVAACWPVAGALVLQAILERRARPPWKFGAVLRSRSTTRGLPRSRASPRGRAGSACSRPPRTFCRLRSPASSASDRSTASCPWSRRAAPNSSRASRARSTIRSIRAWAGRCAILRA
ncbi:MAG: hypothetical protein HY812_09670 [Planctomycetes bacterium]|nr:hypothetical protein [Planctomycetota bacterium]